MATGRPFETQRAIDERQPQDGTLSILVFMAIYAVNFFRIGYQLVLTAWLAVQISHRASSVGYVLLTASLTNLIFSPVIGKANDSIKRKKLILIFGYLGIVVSGSVPLIISFMPSYSGGLSVLVWTVVLLTISGLFASGAMDYFTKTYVPAASRMSKLASINMITQIALIVGTGVAGAVVSTTSPRLAFLVISACGAVSLLLCACYLPDLTLDGWTSRGWRRGIFSSGPFLYFSYPLLFSVACCTALVFSVGQTTNTLLPALINIYLKRSSINYSFVETSWSAGALVISALMAGMVSRHVGRTTHDLMLVAAMAGMLAAIPYLPSFAILLVVHLLLGAGFAFVRVRSETRFLALCPTQLLGQFRANGLFLTSLIGLVVFGTPIIYSDLSVPNLYLLLAAMIMASAIFFCIIARFHDTAIDDVA